MNPLEFHSWYPTGAGSLLAAGGSNFVAKYDDDTVLKYPIIPPNESGYDAQGQAYRDDFRARTIHGLYVEEQILRWLEYHPRIIRLQKTHKDGLLLEYMPKGTVGHYLRDVASTCSLKQRLKWAHQAAEAVAYIHSKSVLHCDISIGNLLLDANLDIKLSDFQGRLLNPDGTILLNGGAAESPMSSMPRTDKDYCDFKTDIFALGTAIFFIITGSQPFTDIDPVEEEEEVQRRFRDKEFPSLENSQGGDIIRSCWMGLYQSAQDIVHDIECLQVALKLK